MTQQQNHLRRVEDRREAIQRFATYGGMAPAPMRGWLVQAERDLKYKVSVYKIVSVVTRITNIPDKAHSDPKFNWITQRKAEVVPVYTRVGGGRCGDRSGMHILEDGDFYGDFQQVVWCDWDEAEDQKHIDEAVEFVERQVEWLHEGRD